MRRLMTAMLGLAFAAGVQAMDVAGVNIPDKASVGGQDLVLNGAGVRTRAIFKVYVGSLYVPAKATSLPAVLAKGPRRIQMHLLRNLSADQLADALVDGLKENNSEAELAAVKAQQDQLVTAMKGFGDVKEKDVVALDYVNGATQVVLNGQVKATIPGDAFNAALTKIWLGERPIQADLKKAMLGG